MKFDKILTIENPKEFRASDQDLEIADRIRDAKNSTELEPHEEHLQSMVRGLLDKKIYDAEIPEDTKYITLGDIGPADTDGMRRYRYLFQSGSDYLCVEFKYPFPVPNTEDPVERMLYLHKVSFGVDGYFNQFWGMLVKFINEYGIGPENIVGVVEDTPRKES